ncbi:endonuclease domain-containing protein [Streptomyces sp. NPDC003943]
MSGAGAVKRCVRRGEEKPRRAFAAQRAEPDGSPHHCRVHGAGPRRTCAQTAGRQAGPAAHGGHKHCPGAGRDHAIVSPDGLRGSCRKAPAAHVDHCHETGRVRGVLCFNCNSAIGKLGDDPDVLRRAIAYLEGNAWKQTR